MANSACTGKPNVRYYKSTESMERFGQVQKWLNFYCKKVSNIYFSIFDGQNIFVVEF